eukprot:TRINITY_DN4076_c0_g1_i1.p1 TRINITY_DN4076_c0_g1~~TRINITY_DN4076_c0_g1_i1.p1  ORF type:complete len:219 (-),score=124.42 TRINITY_DN4076_c0_g1_i1:14-610(-)
MASSSSSAAAVEVLATPPGCLPAEVNARGIQGIPFIENVELFLQNEESVDAAIKRLNGAFQQYKMLEERLKGSRANLIKKIPEVEKNLSVVKQLESQRGNPDPILTQYELADDLYALARLEAPSSVCLWLGADVMVEYPLEEARALLESQLSAATQNLAATEEDLRFLKSQITTTEVNTARVFNHDVRKRRRQSAASS